MRYVAIGIGVAALIGFGWVFSLPSKAECVASGRVVDPTERHCESPTGYQQLREHALFHSRDVILGAALVLAGAYAVHRYRRRSPKNPAPTA